MADTAINTDDAIPPTGKTRSSNSQVLSGFVAVKTEHILNKRLPKKMGGHKPTPGRILIVPAQLVEVVAPNKEAEYGKTGS